MRVIYFGVCLVLFLIDNGLHAQSLNDIESDVKNQLEGKIPKLPEADPEQVRKLFLEKCKEQGVTEEEVGNLKSHEESIQDCVKQYINPEEIKNELDEAKKTGSMDEVFGKYCKLYPDVYKCIENATETVKKCMNPKEQTALEKGLKIVGELQEFMCYRDGDRMAMFVAEGGIECLNQTRNEIQTCVNDTLGDRIPADISASNLPLFLFTERECSDFVKTRKCVNVELEKCPEKTPANIVDAFFKFVSTKLPCNNNQTMASVRSAPSSAAFNTISGITFTILLVAKLF